MKRIAYGSIIALAFIGSCTKEEVTPRSYPRVKTLEVTNITSGGASFSAEIVYTSVPIVDHGFIWSENSDALFSNSDKILLGSKSGTGRFEAQCDRSLQEGKTYYVRGFAISEDHKVYGEVVTFVSLGGKAPSMKDFYPSLATWDDTVTIVGENFSSVLSKNVVTFNNVEALVLKASTDTLQVKVPFNLTEEFSTVSVSLVGNVSTLPKKFQLEAPVLTSISPASVIPGSNVIVSGRNIRSPQTKVYVNAIESAIVKWDSKTIEFTVPSNIPAGNSIVKVVSGSGNLFDTIPLEIKGPKLYSVSPVTASVNEIVTLTGDFFVPQTESNTVMFDNNLASIVSATSTQIQVFVPYVTRVNPTITVTSYGASVSIDMFSIRSPEVTGFAPKRGTTYTEIIITGKHFLPGDFHKVYLDNIPLENTYAPNENEVHAFARGLSQHSGKIKVTFFDQELIVDGEFKTPWIVIPDFPGDHLYSSTSLVYNNKAYIGFGGAPELSNQFWRLDPVSNTWNKLNDFPGPERYTNFAFVVGSKGYVGGGYGDSDKLEDHWEYDFGSDTWVKKSDIPIDGNVSIGFALSDEGYVIDYDFLTGVSRLWKYDSPGDSWSMISTAPVRIDGNTKHFVIGSSLYFVDSSLGNLWKYTASNNQWTMLGNIPTSFSFAFSIGGTGYAGSSNLFYKYDPISNEWTSELTNASNYDPDMYFSVNGKAYLIGGHYDFSNYFETSFEYDPSY